jgi:short-subunit dehydrogenase
LQERTLLQSLNGLNKGDYEYALSGIGTTIAHRGGVINLASTAAFQPLAGATVYAASKVFVLFFTEGLALELERSGVKVTAACPGPAATQFFVNMNPSSKPSRWTNPARCLRNLARVRARQEGGVPRQARESHEYLWFQKQD